MAGLTKEEPPAVREAGTVIVKAVEMEVVVDTLVAVVVDMAVVVEGETEVAVVVEVAVFVVVVVVVCPETVSA